jgi:eukaryotic-like serine/threonine-protein kinase
MHEMTPERWQRLEAVLRGAIDLDAETRNRYLQQCCGDDDELRRAAESLLAFEPHADSLILGAIQAAAAEFEAVDSSLNSSDRLGVYRIVREIGRGGMGTVYLAERDDKQFQKQVAIKVVRHGMDTEHLLRRFRRERQILAHLDHPHIARLLDGGSTEDGRPFLVMEYKPGTAITSYCDEHRLGTRRRIELFLKVCSAVQSAHQNLMVHRDLKPGNILVNSEG